MGRARRVRWISLISLSLSLAWGHSFSAWDACLAPLCFHSSSSRFGRGTAARVSHGPSTVAEFHRSWARALQVVANCSRGGGDGGGGEGNLDCASRPSRSCLVFGFHHLMAGRPKLDDFLGRGWRASRRPPGAHVQASRLIHFVICHLLSRPARTPCLCGWPPLIYLAAASQGWLLRLSLCPSVSLLSFHAQIRFSASVLPQLLLFLPFPQAILLSFSSTLPAKALQGCA